MDYLKQLREQVINLENKLETKEIEMALFESEMQKAFEPSVLLNQQNFILISMLEEVYEFHLKKPSERSKASIERLMNLLDINSQLEKKVYYNVALQRTNKDFATRIQILRVDNMNLKDQLKRITDAEQF